MNEVRDALFLASSRTATMAERALYPVTLVTDGEWLAYRPGPPAGQLAAWLEACRGGVCLLESLLPEIRLLALRIALRRGLPQHAAPARIADPADWLAARILLLEWHQVALGLDELPLLDCANRRAAELAGAAGLPAQPALPVLLPSGRGTGSLRGWSPRPPAEGGAGGVAAAIEASRRASLALAARHKALREC